jgi:hypothetical protein
MRSVANTRAEEQQALWRVPVTRRELITDEQQLFILKRKKKQCRMQY